MQRMGVLINLRYLQKPKDEPRNELGRKPRRTRQSRVSSKRQYDDNEKNSEDSNDSTGSMPDVKSVMAG